MTDEIHIHAIDGENNEVLYFAARVVPPVGAILQEIHPPGQGWIVVSQCWQIHKSGLDGVRLRVLPEDEHGSGNQAEPAGTEGAPHG